MILVLGTENSDEKEQKVEKKGNTRTYSSAPAMQSSKDVNARWKQADA